MRRDRVLVRFALVMALFGLMLAGLAREARAFCGFYVAGADAKLTNGATFVVLMRDGSHTVLSMQNHYEGPPEGFAMVVPVPVVLQKDNVRTLPAEVFDRIDKLSAPRLVEYWEQDPCGGINLGALAGMGRGTGTGQGFGNGRGISNLGVKVEAQFAVGEYEIVILSAEDAAGLETWLKGAGYKIPDGAAPLLRPYVERGTKFFVAKVDPTKVKLVNGAAMLSPLRFDYESPSFELPVRLGLVNSGGMQDLVVAIFAEQRYEVANYDNITVPTNLDVPDSARDHFAATYADIFDRALAAHPKAVVTEYAWSSGSCDPCPGPTLTGADFATLGGDVSPTFHGTTAAAGSVDVRAGTVSATGPVPMEVVSRIVRQNFGRFRLCYERGLQNNPTLDGRVTATFTITPKGDVTKVATEGVSLADPAAVECIGRGFGNLSFPDGPTPTKVVYPLVFMTGAPSTALSPVAARWVLTRLHARYGKDALGEDLVFRPAPPITGGREVVGPTSDAGALEHGATVLPMGTTAGAVSNFQARYAIRHPWTGAVACETPTRGIWGGRPGGGATPPLAAQGVAFARSGGGTAAAAEPLPAPKAKSCGGCALVGDSGEPAALLVAALTLAAAALRRRSSRLLAGTSRSAAVVRP